MANGFDPRVTASTRPATVGREGVAFDAGLRSYMLSVYNYMASGVLLTGIVALLFARSGAVASLINLDTGSMSLLGWIVMLAPLG
ncbi:MAG: BAX inhibitor (BI)-1/YccA family protein, partial [Sphingomonadales bacterium]